MKPRHPMQAPRGENGQMLQVSLAPSPVPRSEIQQRRRALLETSAERGRHVDRPACAPHESGFHKIVAEDMPAKWLAAPQFGQAGIFRKCAYADDGIMPPIIALGAVPPRDPDGGVGGVAKNIPVES